ncbi:MAG: CDP-glycerol glycerophosphotransferase family protein [Ignavibacteria bacterium]|nr:CDP-glycerol glycerophosphotransferase family protein [Ignavibacteria bacterium]
MGCIKSPALKILELQSRMLRDKLRGKKIIILDIEELSLIPYILPIYNFLKSKTNKISYYIATHYPGDIQLAEFGIPLKKQFNVKFSKKLTCVDIFLSPHIYGLGNKDSLKIHINHNQPVKYESYQKSEFVNFDIHFLTSPLHREQTENTIKKYGLEDRGIRLYNTGYSKSDKLLNGGFNREEILKELNLDPSKKTVIYAPSWDAGLSLRKFGNDVIRNILKNENINLIVKLHPISYCPEDGPNYKFYTGGINWRKKLSEFEKHGNFRHVPVNSIDPLLEAADVMVTDVSSVALEFIMLDKPVIYIDCPEFFEKTLKEIYSTFGDTTAEFVKNDPKANAGRHVGDVVYDIENLSMVIDECLKNPERLSDKRKEFAKQLSYNPGRAAEAGGQKILELLEL